MSLALQDVSNATIGVLDTGVCNSASLLASLRRAGARSVTRIDSSTEESAKNIRDDSTYTHVIVPGVGHFSAAMKAIKENGFADSIQERVSAGLPTLFICIGLQVLSKASEESPGTAGLGILRGSMVERFPETCVVPQQSWNKVTPGEGCVLLRPASFAFFSNSYCLRSVPIGWSAAMAVYQGVQFVAGLERGDVLALQFHPELSGTWGTQLLNRWLSLGGSGLTTDECTSDHARLVSDKATPHRVIPCLDVRDGRVVKGIQFRGIRDAGDPSELAREYERQGADELVMLDISATPEGRSTAIETVKAIRSHCCLPLTVGGGVRSVETAGALLSAGADKVAVNSAAVSRPELIGELASAFGTQCVVLAVDARRAVGGGDDASDAASSTPRWNVVVRSGSVDTGKDVVQWCKQGVSAGAGEILLTSFDRDGTRDGFDLELLHAVSSAVNVPVVASGGANTAKHMQGAILKGGASAVLAASIFHDGDTTVAAIKGELELLGVCIRPVVPAATAEDEQQQQHTVDRKSGGGSAGSHHRHRDSQFGQAIIPSIDLMGGKVVQLVGGDEKAVAVEVDPEDVEGLVERFRVAGEIAVVDLDAAMGKPSVANEAIIRRILPLARCRVGGGIRSVKRAKMWLDAGAERVVVGTAASVEFLQELDMRDRVCVALDSIRGEVVVNGWKTRTGKSVTERIVELAPYCTHFLLTAVEREGRMQGVDLEALARVAEAVSSATRGDVGGGDRTPVCITAAGGVSLPSHVEALDRLGMQAQVGMSLYTGVLDLGDAMVAPMRSDRADGLWPTIVVEESTRCVLGLVYSSAESVREAVRTRTGVYYSRSRGKLWYKGSTSGDTQELLRISMDCDRDALCFTVRQSGNGFCHRAPSNGPTDCFSNPTRGIQKLALTIASRMAKAVPGSYTQRLFSDPHLLRAKLFEEAGELSDATEPDHVAQETADVLYFALVSCYSKGASFEDVERVLDGRSAKVTRRKGDAKVPLPSTTTPTGDSSKGDDSPKDDSPSASSDDGALLPIVDGERLRDVMSRRDPTPNEDVMNIARGICEDVRTGGMDALLSHGARLGDLPSADVPIEGAVVLGPDEMKAAYDLLPSSQQGILRRTAMRIKAFAVTQRSSLQECSMKIPGGRAGQSLGAVTRAGCYAPGGRYPLPSTVLMGCIPARVAGCEQVWVASPHPPPLMLAAAHVAQADRFLAVGGAQAIAAMAYGCGPHVPACDVIVGPGNAFVTAAKRIVAGRVRIDMLAGPSELLVVADSSADPAVVAADLLAQAEHDVMAAPILVTTDGALPARVQEQLSAQLDTLPTAEVAREAIRRNGFAAVARDAAHALELADAIAAEHVEIHMENARAFAKQMHHYGALFIGSRSAEVLGDYGAGPNHTLPTGGTARAYGGLSVLTFLRVRTWLDMGPAIPDGAMPPIGQDMIQDCVDLALLEGLHGHSRSAALRLVEAPSSSSDDGGGGGGALVVSVPSMELPLPDCLKETEISLALPKGRMMEGVMKLMAEAGLAVKFASARDLRPKIPAMPLWSVKMLKPRNVVEALHLGTRDVGFAGIDIINETDACVDAVYDTGMDPVRVVVAAPESVVEANRGSLPLGPLRIATEYERLTRQWCRKKGMKNVTVIRTFGSTEVFVPEDADAIVDNTATGTTLRAARLAIVEVISTSSTHLVVHPSAMHSPSKKWAVRQLKMLLASALDARGLCMIEFNVSSKKLDECLGMLPALRSPTISNLWQGEGHAVKIAIRQPEVARVIPQLKRYGATDIVVTSVNQLVL